MSKVLMAVKILVVAFLCVAVASASGCCRGFNILQYRRPGVLPMYETPPPCGSFFNEQEPNPYENPIFPQDQVEKFEVPLQRFYSPYMEPKNIAHKCVCSKCIASQRVVANVPRYYKRGYCNEPMIETITPPAVPPCGQYPCGQYGQYGMQFGQCGQYEQFNHCSQYDHCDLPQPLLRQPPRVLPLTLPASCVC